MERSGHTSDYAIAVSAALAVHVAFLLGVAFLAPLLVAVSEARSEPDPRVSVTVELRPDYFSRVEKPLEAVPEDQRKKFQRTSDAQETGERPDNAPFIGERDTVAKSESEASPDGPPVPAQEGREPRLPGEMQSLDSSFQEGSEPELARQLPQEARLPAAENLPQPMEEEVKGLTGEDREDRIGAPGQELLKTENQIPVPKREGEDTVRDEEMRPKEAKATSPAEAANVPGGTDSRVQQPVEEQPKEPGFRTEAAKTRLQGSISRRGKSSFDVENSPMGRYQAKLSRAVENEWQKNCVRYRDHITPGMLTIRFLIDEEGGISGLRFIDSVQTGEIQKGFTLKSIQNADIPAMPSAVAGPLEGEPLELIYNFFF